MTIVVRVSCLIQCYYLSTGHFGRYIGSVMCGNCHLCWWWIHSYAQFLKGHRSSPFGISHFNYFI